MKAAVITHHFPHDNIEPAIERLRSLADQHDCELLFDRQNDREQYPTGVLALTNEELRAAKPDVSLVIGGDGSILRSLRTFAGVDVPTFGFNFGTIGFLTTVERDDLQSGIHQALTGDFEVLKLPGLRLRYGDIDALAINDISFHRSRDARVAEVAYLLGNEQVGRVRCDGVVAATPAGSTGYNLANNGPILAWGVEGFVVSFIAPHTLTARALVAAPDDVLGVANAGRLDELEILVDGLMVGTLPVGETAELTFVDDQAALAQVAGANFYHRFREKLQARQLTELRAAAVKHATTFVRDGLYKVRVLIELRIENLLLIERAELSFDRGLNVITGETGAGKTVLAHAIDLLLGGKSRKGIVRAGATEAYVEGLFRIPDRLLERPEFAELRERLPQEGASEVALARRVTPEGRTRAYIEGRSATAGDLQLLGGALVAFYGQHEHRKLTLGGAQLSTLDAFAVGVEAKHSARLNELASLHGEATRLQNRLAELELVDGRRERELGLIEFELAEIESLAPQAAEELQLAAEREKLKAVDSLRGAGEASLEAFDGDESGGACALLASAVGQLQTVGGADAALDELAQRADALMIELRDITADLRHYSEGLSADPERLAFLDDRLDGYERLKRKHGGSLEAVLEHAERCREDRERLAGSQEQIEESAARLDVVNAEREGLAKQVTKARRTAAPKLASAVRERLAKLALADASFEIEIKPVDGDIRPSGCDAVEFMIAPNPGIAPTPLRETASGGELSRVMLALLTAGAGGGGGESSKTFVFDEIDAGIGGHTARAVGEQLAALGADRQVICITHLPQVAAAANRHFQIEKSADGSGSRTDVNSLDPKAVVDELCRMMGASVDDSGARKHARELLATA